MVRQIAEHNHYVQGVAWDPLNEFVATQSSDRSVHIYTLKSKDGQFSLSQHGKISRMDLPPRRRVSSSSPAPPDFSARGTNFPLGDAPVIASPAPSTPGTPTSFSLPMNPPILAASRRSSFSSSPSLRRSTSPSPALPLPAVKPMEFSPKVHGLGVKNANIYYNETLTSFFRRLTFTPDGSLLLTPAGQYRTSNPTTGDGAKTADDIINTVYIYTRAGLNKPPIAHLPGHKKPSIAVKCSPVLYTFRKSPVATKHITVDTSSPEDALSLLPPPAVGGQNDTLGPSGVASGAPASQPSGPDPAASTPNTSAPSNAAFSLPYRMVYAVATQDAVLIYDTQQQTPLCVVSNLHYAAFTDLTWLVSFSFHPSSACLNSYLTSNLYRSSDGNTLLMTSTDGFCSVVVFSLGELGEKYTGPIASTGATTPSGTPTHPTSNPTPTHKTPLTPVLPVSPAPPTRHSNSPTRSSSSSSINTLGPTAINNPRPTVGSLPSVAASVAGVPLTTPPQTPLSANSSVLGKRDEGPVKQEGSGTEGMSDVLTGGDKKRRRIAPTQVVTDGTQETPNVR